MAEATKRRPFKICNSQRTLSKGIVVGSLSELKQRGSEKLNWIWSLSSCRVLLDADGTEVDDEEYFSFLEEQTIMMLVGAGEEWTPRGEEISVNASLETNESLDVDHTDAPEDRTASLTQRMRRDPLFFVSFSDEDLNTVISCDSSELATVLGREGREATYYQEICQRELDRRSEMREATELLKLYDKAVKKDNQEPGLKRPKT